MRVLFFLCLSCSAAFAQPTGAIGGRVVDDLGDPLPGANVVLQGTQLRTATDIDGNFTITGIPLGQYEVAVSFVGYTTPAIAVDLSLRQTRWLNVELVPEEWAYWESVRRNDPGCDTDYAWNWYRLRDPFLPRAVSGEELECLPTER